MKQTKFLKSFSLLLVFCLSISLFVATPVQAQSLSASPNNIEIGPNKKITVTFSGAPGNENDYIGLWRVGDQGPVGFLDRQVISSKTSGTLEFDAPEEPGNYEFQMWEGNRQNKLATSNPISVDWGKASLSHTIGTHYIGRDKKIQVSFSNAPGFQYDSISIWEVGGTRVISHQWLEGKTSGNIQIKAPQEPGSYEFKMEGNRKSFLVKSSPFKCKFGPVNMKVSIGSPDSQGKRKLTVQYNGAPGYYKDAIGLYKVGQTEAVARVLLGAKTSGAIELTCPIDTDSYEIQLWAQNELFSNNMFMLAKTLAFIPKNGPPPPVNQDPNNPLPPLADYKITILLTIGSKNAYVNKQLVVLDVPPFIDSGRTFVPFRFIGESLGAVVGFSKDTSGRVDTVTYSIGTTNIILYIDKREATVNGSTVYLDVAPKILQGRTVIPLRFVTEALGCKVEWDGQKMQVTIVYPA
ncbi:MAG: copper amine oxidase N-terminal domain-containing protein [Caldisericia bacterium]|nr:copper amine oxidase N-terminal domain-containing protein [Caldisericia bacterium]